MNKRDTVLKILDEGTPQEFIPAGFFMHFDPAYHRGQAAVDKHLEYFRFTGMDFVKIQFENKFPVRQEIRRPEDWSKIPLYKEDFYRDQLDIVAGLLKETQKEALVIMTLYSPFMCAGHTTTRELITAHIREAPDEVKKGMEIITESLMFFVKASIKLGVDGFYTSTQGGESHRFGDSPLFETCIRPYDLALMEEVDRNCMFNILHVCDGHGDYNDLTPFLEYPGHIVNCSPAVGAQTLTSSQISRMFQRPFMGGLDRKGVIATGTVDEIGQTVRSVVDQASERFILGADCTLPREVSWDNIRTAISAAHGDFEAATT